MTLIASFYVNDVPCLLSDCIISRQVIAGDNIVLPLSGHLRLNSATLIPQFRRFPSGLTQKTAICGTNLACAWSGRVATAREVIAELWEKNAKEPFTVETLAAHWSRLSSTIWTDICVLGFLRVDDHTLRQFWAGTDTAAIPSSRFRKIVTAGSGAKTLNKFLDGNAVDVLNGHYLGKLAAPMIAPLWTTANLMAHELSNPNFSLGNQFGAIYETTVLTPQGFRKVEDVTFVFWRIDLLSNAQINLPLFPTQAIRHAYHEDLFLIRPLKSSSANEPFQQECYVITPPYREVSPRELAGLSMPRFDSKLLMHVIEFSGSDSVTDNLIITDYSDNESPYLRIDESPEVVHFYVSQAFHDCISDRVSERKKHVT